MKLYDITQTITGNQKCIKAGGFTSKNWKLKNKSNDGKSPLDSDWNKKETIVIAAGTWVDYTMQETHSGDVHTITYTTNGDKYYRTVTKEK